MKRCLMVSACALALVILGYPVGAGDKKGDGFDVAKLVGKWTYVSGEKGGEKVDADSLKKQKVTITKDTWTLQGEDKFVMKYTVDGKKNPATIKLTMTESPFGTGMVAEGIIEVKGDELRICYAPEGEKTPTKFETKEGTKAHMFVLKRTK